MSRIKKTAPAPALASQQERLRRWLIEWKIDQCLRSVDVDVDAESDDSGGRSSASRDEREDEEAVRRQITPCDARVEAGEIRLLSPVVLPAATEPVYIAVLRRWDAQWLVAPYSRYGEPGTPEELHFPTAIPIFRVLCLWNARTVPESVIGQSWKCGELKAKDLKDALCVFRYFTLGDALSAALLVRIGPPVVHPADPRRRYVSEGLVLLAPLTAASLAAAKELDERIVDFPVVRRLPQAAAYAADSGTKVTRKLTIRVYEAGPQRVKVRISERAGKPGTFGFTVVDKNKSPLLEGAELLTAKGKVLTTVRNGKGTRVFRVPAGGILLRLANGDLAVMKSVKK